MRTTLTIDADVEMLLEQEVQRSRKSFKDVVNEALRRGLTRAPVRGSRVQVKVFESKLCPGYDPRAFNKLTDELEDEAVMGKIRR